MIVIKITFTFLWDYFYIMVFLKVIVKSQFNYIIAIDQCRGYYIINLCFYSIKVYISKSSPKIN